MKRENEQENADQVIWAMGGRRTSSLAHAYLGEKEFEKGECLCGRNVKPQIRFEEWLLEDESLSEHTCPFCRERLAFLPFIQKHSENSGKKE